MIETFDVKPRRRSLWIFIVLGIMGLGIFLMCGWWLSKPPNSFPIDNAVTIPRGLSASAIANRLEEEKLVRSSGFLYMLLITQHDPSSIQAGIYFFDHPLSVFEVANRITKGVTADNLVSVTLPEGYTVKEYAGLAKAKLPDFDEEAFVNEALQKEGFLFPDTYYLPADFTAAELVALMSDTYEQKISELRPLIAKTGLTEKEVITLASIIEREANTEESMRVVSGILQNRLKKHMPLQADASLEYVLGHSLNELDAADLELDSPYNTYLNHGLPPTPVGNPGLTSIKAVLDPEVTDYLYYLTDPDGNFHYSKTYEGHKKNVEMYLK